MPPSRRKKSANVTLDNQEQNIEEVAVNPESEISTAALTETTQSDQTTNRIHLLQSAVQNSKSIDPNLNPIAEQIEKQNSNLFVLAARQFHYKIIQTLVEVLISEPRKFNVLEEFILRASIEFTPPPTIKELASVLGLDLVFVESTAENLESLKSLKISTTGSIQITPQGQEFYKQGSVSLPPQTKQIYAITDHFQENISFQFEALSEEISDLPELKLIPIENNLPDIQSLTISEIQKLIQQSSLGLHVPEDGKILTNFHVIGKPQEARRTISIFVLQDVIENRYTIQVRRNQQILEKPSQWLRELEAQQKISLKNLGLLPEEVLNPPEPIVPHPQSMTETKPKSTKSKSPRRRKSDTLS